MYVGCHSSHPVDPCGASIHLLLVSFWMYGNDKQLYTWNLVHISICMHVCFVIYFARIAMTAKVYIGSNPLLDFPRKLLHA